MITQSEPSWAGLICCTYQHYSQLPCNFILRNIFHYMHSFISARCVR